MSLKRHPALRPFSRDHVIGLFHAHQLMWLSEGRARFDLATTMTNFRLAWEEEILKHFADEEMLLQSLAVRPESIDQLISDHKAIRLSVSNLLGTQEPELVACYNTGKMLEQHIRWEEHVFFPEIEQLLSPSQLQVLEEETRLLERACKRSQDV